MVHIIPSSKFTLEKHFSRRLGYSEDVVTKKATLLR